MQTTFLRQPAIGISGTLVTDEHTKRSTLIAAEAITPGRYVVRNAAGKAIHPVAAPTPGNRGGFAIRSMYQANDGVYAAGDEVDVLEEGLMYVDSETAVAINGDVYVRHTAGVGEFLGKVRNSADALAATGAVVSLTETDANVEDGTFQIVLEDLTTGAIYDAQFTSSTSTHAAAAAGLVAAIEAAGPFDATAAAEAADAIAITIVSTTSTTAVAVRSLTSVGASALAVVSQGVANPDASKVGAFFRNTLGAAGLSVVEVFKSHATA